jgi:hypothetical protein
MTLLRDEVGAKNFHLTRHSRADPPYGGGMIPVDPNTAREFLEALIAGFSVLGGVMAYSSGYAAYRTLAHDESPPVVAHNINEGVGEGFEAGMPLAVVALMIMGWT